MQEIKLNIYNRKTKEIEKTYCVDSVDLMFGTVEDIINVIDVDKLNDRGEAAKMIIAAWGQLKPFLKDIFPELTDEEIKGIKINEMIPVFFDIFRAISENMGILANGKN